MDEGQALQQRLQDAVNKMMDNIDKSKMRPLQKATYLKMASCFDNNNASTQQIDHCQESNSHNVKQAQSIIQTEMGQFQNRLQRCSLACEDEVKDKFSYMDQNDNSSQEKAQGQYLKCNSICVDKHIAMLKSVEAKIVNDIEKIIR
jgi:hypothetical protein